MFKIIKTLQGKEKIINLNNISSIIFGKEKVIFHFNNEINIIGKETSDFVECDVNEFAISDLPENFLITSEVNEAVNLDAVNSITFEDEKRKIIFNLSHPIDIEDNKTGEKKKVSKFVYWRFNNVNDYETNKQYVLNKIKETK